MSVNDIDVNAVNERNRKESFEFAQENLQVSSKSGALEAKIAGSTPETSDKEIAELATYMRGSIRWKIAYRKLRAIMLLESLVWTLMDIVRAWRMRTAARINDNYKSSKK